MVLGEKLVALVRMGFPQVKGFVTITDLFRVSTYANRYIGSGLKCFLPEADLDDCGRSEDARRDEGLAAEHDPRCRSSSDDAGRYPGMEADIPLDYIRRLIDEAGEQYGQIQDALRR